MSGESKLAKFLTEVSNWTWEEFVKAEKNAQYTSNEAVIFALIRSCAMQKMSAIRLSLNRLDGKLKTPIKIEYPKIFYLYPNATLGEGDTRTVERLNPSEQPNEPTPEDPVVVEQALQIMEGEVVNPPAVVDDMAEPDDAEPDLPSMSLRQTLTKMSDYPRALPEAVVQLAFDTEQWVGKRGPKPDEIPRVKSVVAAHLLVMAQNRNIDALTEVFDQIDGKLVETLQILGEDIYITSYASTAPEGAELNKDGVLQIEAKETQALWTSKFEKETKR